MNQTNGHKKPTGDSGVTKISADAEGSKADFKRLEFPHTKDQIEKFIVENFLRLAPSAGVFPHTNCTVLQNPESDLDFTLHCADKCPRKLELMEVAPLEHLRGSYTSAPSSYKPYEFGRYILNKMLSKSSKYGLSGQTELHLLIYITDWKFILSQSVTALLQYWTLKTSHNFAGIYVYMPINETEGVSQLIFPTPHDHWKSFNPDTLKDNVVQNLDPKGWKSGGNESSNFQKKFVLELMGVLIVAAGAYFIFDVP